MTFLLQFLFDAIFFLLMETIFLLSILIPGWLFSSYIIKYSGSFKPAVYFLIGSLLISLFVFILALFGIFNQSFVHLYLGILLIVLLMISLLNKSKILEILSFKRYRERLIEVKLQYSKLSIDKLIFTGILIAIIFLSINFIIFRLFANPPQPGDGMAIWDLKGYGIYIDGNLDSVFLSRVSHPIYTPTLHAWGYMIFGGESWDYMQIYTVFYAIWLITIFQSSLKICSIFTSLLITAFTSTLLKPISIAATAYVDFPISVPSIVMIALLLEYFLSYDYRNDKQKKKTKSLDYQIILMSLLGFMPAWMKSEGLLLAGCNFLILITGIAVFRFSMLRFVNNQDQKHSFWKKILKSVYNKEIILSFCGFPLIFIWQLFLGQYGIKGDLVIENYSLNTIFNVNLAIDVIIHMFQEIFDILEYNLIIPIIRIKIPLLFLTILPLWICFFFWFFRSISNNLVNRNKKNSVSLYSFELLYSGYVIMNIFVVFITMYLSSSIVGGPYSLTGSSGQYAAALNRLLLHVEVILPFSLILAFKSE